LAPPLDAVLVESSDKGEALLHPGQQGFRKNAKERTERRYDREQALQEGRLCLEPYVIVCLTGGEYLVAVATNDDREVRIMSVSKRVVFLEETPLDLEEDCGVKNATHQATGIWTELLTTAVPTSGGTEWIIWHGIPLIFR